MIMTGGKVGRESQLKNLGVVTEYYYYAFMI